MIGIIVSLLLSLLFVYLFFNTIAGESLLDHLLFCFLVLSAHIILAFEIASFFSAVNKPWAFLLIQAGMIGLGLILNRVLHIGYPHGRAKDAAAGMKRFWDFIRHNVPTFLFGLLVAAVYVFLIYLQFRFPQNTSDSLYNHLARIGHWLQQGSLKTYFSFNEVGTTYPYNNSLLMMWSALFLSSDKLVGLVQLTAALMISAAICRISRELGFNSKGGTLAGLLFLTFPIVALESITAQNDVLLAAFLLAAFYFLLKALHNDSFVSVFLSLLAFSLAVGTKQLVFCALPGYAALFLYYLAKKKWAKKLLLKCTAAGVVCVLFFGSFAYLQNWIVFGNPVGTEKLYSENLTASEGTLFGKEAVNNVRLAYQFISCDGLPLQTEIACVNGKASLLRPLLVNSKFNVESESYLLEKSNPFLLENRYPLNEESAWFGFAGWIVISLGFILGIVFAIRKRKPEAWILVLTSLVYTWLVVAVRPGWSAYCGRFLIFSAALLLPFAAEILGSKRILIRLITFILYAASLYALIFSVANDDSRPLVGKNQFLELQVWGKDNSVLIQKIAYKLTPTLRNEKDVWSMNPLRYRTVGVSSFYHPLTMVEQYVPQDGALGILAHDGYFLDYLFYGDSLQRRLFEITRLEDVNTIAAQVDYLLVSPDFEISSLPGFTLASEVNHWKLFASVNHPGN